MTCASSSGVQVWNLDANDLRNNIKPEDAWDDIKNGVNSIPTMVFSVIGDSDSFVPRPWPKTVFQTALIEAAKSAGETWILFRGNDEGVSKIVKDAYRNYEDLHFETETISKDDHNRHVKLISIAREKNRNMSNEEQERSATHTCANTKGMQFLLEFEDFVSKKPLDYFGEDMNFNITTPITLIVCEGDIQTISHISKALRNQLPVIIMKGSGKATDVVLEYLENHCLLPKKACASFGYHFNGEEYQKLKTHLEHIGEHRNLIGIFDLERDDPLMLSSIVREMLIITRLLKNIQNTDQTNDKENQLGQTVYKPHTPMVETCMPKNIDENTLVKGFKFGSRPYVFYPKYCTSTTLPLYFYFGYQIWQASQKKKKCGQVLLFEALKANRCDYVRVLMDQKVQLDTDELNDLYVETVSCMDCGFKDKKCHHMPWIMKLARRSETLCEHLLSIVYKKTTNNGPEDDKNGVQKVNVETEARKLCCSILRYKEFILPDDKKGKKTKENNESSANLLLWAIFVNRKELAEICWLRGTHQLLTGLVCSAVLKKLSKRARNAKELVISKDLEDHSKIFEQRCLNMMDKMYEENAKQAIELMNIKASVLGIYSSPITFAYENLMYDVVAHICSQKYMNKKWYNNLPPKSFYKSSMTSFGDFIKAPVTKFAINYIVFTCVLFMYSAFVLTSISTEYYKQGPARILEYSVYFWGLGDLLEEIIGYVGCPQTQGRSYLKIYSRMKRQIYDFWNAVDLLSHGLLITALFLRHFYEDETHTDARRVFALSLLVMYLRFLEVFLIHRTMGPTIIMIKEMLKDLLRFLFIAVFVVLGVGIYYHANLWPDHQTMWGDDLTRWRIWTIIYYPYWQLYGELNLDSLDGSNQMDCSNATSVRMADFSLNRCPQEDWTVQAVAAIYLLFSNLLLVNLVIAMFSYTFERVQTNSEKLWHFLRYTVITDYEERIPSPFSLIVRLIQLINLCRSPKRSLRGCKGGKVEHTEQADAEKGKKEDNKQADAVKGKKEDNKQSDADRGKKEDNKQADADIGKVEDIKQADADKGKVKDIKQADADRGTKEDNKQADADKGKVEDIKQADADKGNVEDIKQADADKGKKEDNKQADADKGKVEDIQQADADKGKKEDNKQADADKGKKEDNKQADADKGKKEDNKQADAYKGKVEDNKQAKETFQINFQKIIAFRNHSQN